MYRTLLSEDHDNWRVIFDSGSKGYKGWQVFNLNPPFQVRYIRIHGINNSKNQMFHVVEIEAHDDNPEPLPQKTLERNIYFNDIIQEIGDGQPIANKIDEIVSDLEQIIKSEFIRPDPFQKIVNGLRKRIRDVKSIEQSMEAIRNEIVNPVKEKLKELFRQGERAYCIAIICGILAVIALALQIFQLLK